MADFRTREEVRMSVGPHILLGTDQADVITGGSGDDVIDGRAGNDTLKVVSMMTRCSAALAMTISTAAPAWTRPVPPAMTVCTAVQATIR
jgi:hypothetical protein